MSTAKHNQTKVTKRNEQQSRSIKISYVKNNANQRSPNGRQTTINNTISITVWWNFFFFIHWNQSAYVRIYIEIIERPKAISVIWMPQSHSKQEPQKSRLPFDFHYILFLDIMREMIALPNNEAIESVQVMPLNKTLNITSTRIRMVRMCCISNSWWIFENELQYEHVQRPCVHTANVGTQQYINNVHTCQILNIRTEMVIIEWHMVILKYNTCNRNRRRHKWRKGILVFVPSACACAFSWPVLMSRHRPSESVY